MKFKYRVYGLNIESEIELPELIKLDEKYTNNMDIIITYGKVNIAEKDNIKGTTWTYIDRNNVSIFVEDIAIYQIVDGKNVIIEPITNKNGEIKAFLLGWIFGVIFVQRDIIALHGATLIKNKAITIVGDSGAGKSTISAGLKQRGYKCLSDDISVIEDGEDKMIILPSYPQQRLCRDAMENLGYNTCDYKQYVENSEMVKYEIDINDYFINESSAIDAIFEIEIHDNDTVELEILKGSDKLSRFLENLYFLDIERYIGMRPKYFGKCLKMINNIPMYKIKRPKGKFTIDEQINLIEEVMENL